MRTLRPMALAAACAFCVWGAHDRSAAAQDAPIPTSPPEVGVGVEIPSVDDPAAVRALLPPEERLVELTIGLYDAIAVWEGPCNKMWRPARAFLDAHEAEIEAAALELAARAETMTPEELETLAQWISAQMAAHPSVYAAQGSLYRCLRSADVQGDGRPLDKEMRRFFRLQEPMIDAIIGDVE